MGANEHRVKFLKNTLKEFENLAKLLQTKSSNNKEILHKMRLLCGLFFSQDSILLKYTELDTLKMLDSGEDRLGLKKEFQTNLFFILEAFIAIEETRIQFKEIGYKEGITEENLLDIKGDSILKTADKVMRLAIAPFLEFYQSILKSELHVEERFEILSDAKIITEKSLKKIKSIRAGRSENED